MPLGLLRPNGRNGFTIMTAVIVLSAGYVTPAPMARYAAWLVVFAIWMAWFVDTAVIWLGHADF